MGDLLVVIFLYCLVRAFLKIPVLPAAIGVLLFSYLIEILQYFKIGHHLGLEHSQRAMTIIGSSFEWIDLIAYTAGTAIVLFIEARRASLRTQKPINAGNN